MDFIESNFLNMYRIAIDDAERNLPALFSSRIDAALPSFDGYPESDERCRSYERRWVPLHPTVRRWVK